MASYCSLYFIGILLLSVLQIGSTLKCYSCTTVTSDVCRDPIDTSKLDTLFCNERNYGCMKQVLPSIGSSALTIHRGCTPIAYCEVQTPKSDHCSVCTNDLCNSSSITIPSVVMCFSALLAGFVWKF